MISILKKALVCGLVYIGSASAYNVNFYDQPDFNGNLGGVVAGALYRCYDIHKCPYQDNSQSITIDVGDDNVATCFYTDSDCRGFGRCWLPGQADPSNLNIDLLADTISAFAFVDASIADTSLHNANGQTEYFLIDC
ncbi:hypothetical protein DFJ77DRAFT_510951 [Powellomyces hirtus]|nr:hypothetical protein DFJ77DRAFT_510951 [Powellomyces hirtus]